jgi:hypothetical protein
MFTTSFTQYLSVPATIHSGKDHLGHIARGATQVSWNGCQQEQSNNRLKADGRL